MANDNNISIGSFGNGNNNNNNISISQSPEPPRPAHIVYRIKSGSIQHISRKEVEKSFWISCIGFTADVFGLFSFFGIQGIQALSALQKQWVQYACIGIIIVGFVFLLFNRRNFHLFRIKFSPQEARILGDGTFAERDDGNYLLYQMTARCNYPNGGCPGIVSIETAPEREQLNHHTHIGKCSANGCHTYTVERSEYENIGFQQKFNFEPIDKPKQ
jgi:hypothetical protein